MFALTVSRGLVSDSKLPHMDRAIYCRRNSISSASGNPGPPSRRPHPSRSGPLEFVTSRGNPPRDLHGGSPLLGGMIARAAARPFTSPQQRVVGGAREEHADASETQRSSDPFLLIAVGGLGDVKTIASTRPPLPLKVHTK